MGFPGWVGFPPFPLSSCVLSFDFHGPFSSICIMLRGLLEEGGELEDGAWLNLAIGSLYRSGVNSRLGTFQDV